MHGIVLIVLSSSCPSGMGSTRQSPTSTLAAKTSRPAASFVVSSDPGSASRDATSPPSAAHPPAPRPTMSAPATVTTGRARVAITGAMPFGQSAVGVLQCPGRLRLRVVDGAEELAVSHAPRLVGGSHVVDLEDRLLVRHPDELGELLEASLGFGVERLLAGIVAIGNGQSRKDLFGVGFRARRRLEALDLALAGLLAKTVADLEVEDADIAGSGELAGLLVPLGIVARTAEECKRRDGRNRGIPGSGTGQYVGGCHPGLLPRTLKTGSAAPY